MFCFKFTILLCYYEICWIRRYIQNPSRELLCIKNIGILRVTIPIDILDDFNLISNKIYAYRFWLFQLNSFLFVDNYLRYLANVPGFLATNPIVLFHIITVSFLCKFVIPLHFNYLRRYATIACTLQTQGRIIKISFVYVVFENYIFLN